MGMALLRGWQAQGLEPSFVVDPAAVEIATPHRHVADARALHLDDDLLAGGGRVQFYLGSDAAASVSHWGQRIDASTPVQSVLFGNDANMQPVINGYDMTFVIDFSHEPLKISGNHIGPGIKAFELE